MLEAIDPLTGELITNPDIGLLPADNAQGDGRGTVSYSILPLDSVVTGDEISSIARVIFDNAPPQDTPQLVQTIDALAPTTELAIERLGTAGRDYSLTWSSEDELDGSGVKHATVYVAENGGDFRIWLRRTTDTSAVYSGDPESTYEFLVLATDEAGNQEQPPLGTQVPDDGSGANLGSLPVHQTTIDFGPPAAPSPSASTNPLFVEAEFEVPANPHPTRPSEFRSTLQPFASSIAVTACIANCSIRVRAA